MIRSAVLVGLVALLCWYLGADMQPVQQAAPVNRSLPAGSPAVSVGTFAPMPGPAPAQMPTAAPASAHASTEGALFPFRFLGRLSQGAGSAVVLFGNGRVLTVSAPGVLDDNYVVEDLQASYLVLRHVRLGQTKVLEFTSQQAHAAATSPDDSPQD